MKIGKFKFPLASVACAVAAVIALGGILMSIWGVIEAAMIDLDLLWSSLGGALVSSAGALFFAGSLAYLAIMIYLDRKDWMTLIGFGILLLLKLGDFCGSAFSTISSTISYFEWFSRTWHIILGNVVNLAGVCCLVLGYILLAAMAAAILLKWQHKLVDTLKKLWYIPAAAVLVYVLISLLSSIIALVGNLINGVPFGQVLLSLVEVCIDTVGMLITQVGPALFLAHWLAGLKEKN